MRGRIWEILGGQFDKKTVANGHISADWVILILYLYDSQDVEIIKDLIRMLQCQVNIENHPSYC